MNIQQIQTELNSLIEKQYSGDEFHLTISEEAILYKAILALGDLPLTNEY